MVINEVAHFLKNGLVIVCIAAVRLARDTATDAERPAFSRWFIVAVVDVPQNLGENLGPFREMVIHLWPPCIG
jgi:hypothetical protein